MADHEHFVRFCSRQKQIRDAEDRLIGVTWEAFTLRPERNETYLSGGLLEFVAGDREEQVRSVLEATRNSPFIVTPKHAMALCNVGSLQACAKTRDRKLRIIHEPNKFNAAYSAVRGLPLDNSDMELLSLIAADSVAAHYLVSDLDNP
ncbi:MAG: hypothetical protein K8F25_02700 [Fimbriimonadaceae bacterium]|nr:hypothetical protein [Alphaproteobacteria bacterium]